MRRFLFAALLTAIAVPAAFPQTPASDNNGLKRREDDMSAAGTFQVAPGTRVLLNMINSISTKQAVVGDRLYLETAFPVLANNRIVVPQGSWVTGTITEVKRPGRVKGRGELQVRFDSLTLPNGVSRQFRSDLGALDARSSETLNRENNKIKGPGDKKGDIGTITGRTVDGTIIGSGIGAAAGNVARGAGIGTGIGAATGLAAVLLSRGPDAMLTKGSTVEMVLDRPITFTEAELNFSNAPPRAVLSEGGQTQPTGTQSRFGSRTPR